MRPANQADRAGSDSAMIHRGNTPGAAPWAGTAFRVGETLYGGATWCVRAGFELGWRRTFRLPCKVISVGNLTTGGTGKTPMVQAIATRLRDEGYRVVVLCRGYGGVLSRDGAVVSDGAKVLVSPEAAGDEPVLHGNRLKGIPVIIGRDRVKAGLRAVRDFAAEVVVLDDAYQYCRLYRDLDIVLIDAANPFSGGRLLPAGRLREPVSGLRRADVAVLTRASRVNPSSRDQVIGQVRCHLRADAIIAQADHRPTRLYRVHRTDEACSVDWLNHRRIVAACALGDGEGFVETLHAQGGDVVEAFIYPDHHCFGMRDYLRIASAARTADCPVVITEKDAVKWSTSSAVPEVWVLGIEMQIHEERVVYRRIAAALEP